MSQPKVPPLPLPRSNQAYCDVSALVGGLLVLPEHVAVSTAKKGETHIMPSLAFLITHATTRKRMLLDLGMRRDLENAEVIMAQRFSDVFHSTVPTDVPFSLEKGGLTPEDITLVCLTHCHWDHVGNPALYPSARFLVGGEARSLFQPGYPTDPKSVFPTDLLPEGRTDFLDVSDETWKPIGPFPHALDYFDDGSLYIVDAPGHLPGHLNILVRTSPDGGWACLAGDSAHDWRLIRGQGEIAERHNAVRGHICMHRDKEQAAKHIRRIADVLTLPRVRVILAHDNEWYDANKGGDAFWPGKIKSL
ncbi:hypothetical protein EW145_g1591 [Phellinidium pouzarii]|uniref:Metallo-beta-lactamase domain-containing protein n=1 Tax=Phellinidium pouzarii TaxID=167371 RepID=A0A4V3XDK1_9AGAM|nr:hypothetical protein EW145_g1591 [Phellinidium pouzarii]